jgi:hypothetical protein
VQEPEIADFLKTFRQHMLQEAADELERRQRHGLPGLVVRLVAERDRAVLHGDEPPVRQRHTVDIRCQIFQGGASVPDRLAMYRPGCVPG